MPHFDGLNLTWETLEGLVKHNGPLTDRARRPDRALPRARRCRSAIRAYGERARTSNCGASPAPRRRSRRIADDIAYDAHDIDDGLRAELFALDDLADVAADRRHPREHRAAASAARARPAVHELVRRLITRMIEDVIARDRRAACRRLAPRSADDVRHADGPVGALLGRDGARPTAPSRAFSTRACTAMPRIMRIMGEARARWCATCSRRYAREARRDAGGMGARSSRPRTTRGRLRRDRRFHRRHDRPLRARRARAAF